MNIKTLIAVLSVLLEGDSLISTTHTATETTFETVGFTVIVRPRVWHTNSLATATNWGPFNSVQMVYTNGDFLWVPNLTNTNMANRHLVDIPAMPMMTTNLTWIYGTPVPNPAPRDGGAK